MIKMQCGRIWSLVEFWAGALTVISTWDMSNQFVEEPGHPWRVAIRQGLCFEPFPPCRPEHKQRQICVQLFSYVFICFLCLIRIRFGGDQRVFATRSWLPGAVLCQICFINSTFFWNFTCSQHYLGTHIAWTFSLYQPFSSFFIISHAIIVVPEPQHRNMKATSHMLICRRVNTNTIKYAFQGWTSWIMGWTWSSCVCRAVFCLQTTPWWACIICTYPRYPLYPWINFHPGQVSLSRQHWDEG